MFGRLKILPQAVRTGRLAWRLVRDPRVPLAAKLILGATALYLISPIDLVPDFLPGLGQVDDLVALMAGLNLFIKACPNWLVEEHERRLGGWFSGSGSARREPDVVEGTYRVVG